MLLSCVVGWKGVVRWRKIVRKCDLNCNSLLELSLIRVNDARKVTHKYFPPSCIQEPQSQLDQSQLNVLSSGGAASGGSWSQEGADSVDKLTKCARSFVGELLGHHVNDSYELVMLSIQVNLTQKCAKIQSRWRYLLCLNKTLQLPHLLYTITEQLLLVIIFKLEISKIKCLNSN